MTEHYTDAELEKWAREDKYGPIYVKALHHLACELLAARQQLTDAKKVIDAVEATDAIAQRLYLPNPRFLELGNLQTALADYKEKWK